MDNPQIYCILHIVRHGQTEHNVQARIQGQVDSSLTDTGRQQAVEVANKLEAVKFDAVFSSDLGRAKETAEIIKLDRELGVNTTKLLRERSYGHFEGETSEEFRTKNKELLEKQLSLAEKQKSEFKFYDAYESDTEIAMRMLTALREIAVTYPGQNVLVVSHGAIIRALLVHLGYASYDELDYRVSRSIDNGAYTKIESMAWIFLLRKRRV